MDHHLTLQRGVAASLSGDEQIALLGHLTLNLIGLFFLWFQIFVFFTLPAGKWFNLTSIVFRWVETTNFHLFVKKGLPGNLKDWIPFLAFQSLISLQKTHMSNGKSPFFFLWDTSWMVVFVPSVMFLSFLVVFQLSQLGTQWFPTKNWAGNLDWSRFTFSC